MPRSKTLLACILSIAAFAAGGAKAGIETCPTTRNGLPLSLGDFLVRHPDRPDEPFPMQGGWETTGPNAAKLEYLLRCDYARPEDTVETVLANVAHPFMQRECPATRNGLNLLRRNHFVRPVPTAEAVAPHWLVDTGTYTVDPGYVPTLQCVYAPPGSRVDMILSYDHDKCEPVRMRETGIWNFVCY